jgi:hypothetical protein
MLLKMAAMHSLYREIQRLSRTNQKGQGRGIEYGTGLLRLFRSHETKKLHGELF